MTYGKLLRRMEGAGGVDSVHAASWVAIEFQASAAMLLLLALAARLISPYLALPALVAGALLLRGRQLTGAVLKENDDRLQTLLFYFIATFALITACIVSGVLL